MDSEANGIAALKILYITHSVSWTGGGAFFRALHLAKGMAKLGHQATVLSISRNGRFLFSEKELGDVTIVGSPDLFSGQARSGWDLWNTITRIWFLRSRRYDIVHCLDCRPAVIFPGLFAKYFRSSKLVIEWLDWFGRGGTASERRFVIRLFMVPIETFFEERFRKHADGTIGLGAPLTQRARDMGISHNVINILHGCDTQGIKAFSKHDSRKALGLRTGLSYVGYLGRMREDAIRLFAGLIRELRKKYSIDVVGVLIGNSAFHVDKFIGQDITDSVIRTGWIEYEKVNLYLSACDVLALPFENSVARRSIWPSKLNDYLSVGRPVLSTDLVVLSDIIRNAEVGVLAENTVESLAYRCAELLTDPNKMTILGNNARKLAETTLSWKTICNTVDKFYNDVTLVACHTIEDQKEVQRKKWF